MGSTLHRQARYFEIVPNHGLAVYGNIFAKIIDLGFRMRKQWFVLPWLLIGGGGAAAANEVARIDVRLFYQHSGTLSANIVGKQDLHNVLIGEGDAQEPASSALVDIAVKGEPGSFGENQYIELSVIEEGAQKPMPVLQKPIGVFGAQGMFHVGFWLDDLPCRPLRISARIKGGKAGKEVRLPFQCGE